MPRTAFYAWQSDTDRSTNHHFIAKALQIAIQRLNVDLQIEESEAELAFDRDTQASRECPRSPIRSCARLRGPAAVADRLLQPRACHLLLELYLAQPFDKALVLDLVLAILELHHQLVLLQTAQRIFRCVQRSRLV
jgi:hypothetical protein